MGAVVKLLVVAVAVLIGLFYSGIFSPEYEVPKPRDGWWGRGPKKPDTDTSIREFQVFCSMLHKSVVNFKKTSSISSNHSFEKILHVSSKNETKVKGIT